MKVLVRVEKVFKFIALFYLSIQCGNLYIQEF